MRALFPRLVARLKPTKAQADVLSRIKFPCC